MGQSKHTAICIAGTDTDAGKTFVAAALLRAAKAKNYHVQGLKPVQTGCSLSATGDILAPDTLIYKQACPEATVHCFLQLQHAVSPHLALELAATSSIKQARAKDLQRQASVAHLSSCIKDTLQSIPTPSFSIIEAAGGLMAPLNAQETILDLFSSLHLPIILVVPNRLGAINHALLSLNALKQQGCSIAGFVTVALMPKNAETELILADNPISIARISGVPCLAELPFLQDLTHTDLQKQLCSWNTAARLLEPTIDILIQKNTNAPYATDPNASLLKFDREHIWHPYTSATAPLPVRTVIRTHAAHITLADQRSLIDGMSSWWCAIHGYNHPELVAALKNQADLMPHIMFGGLTHAPAVNLAQKLISIVPKGLEYVFFCDSGSVAVEVALKMAIQYQHAMGHPMRSFIMTIMGGYHGDTLGAMSVCDPVTGMHTLFQNLPKQIFAPKPDCRFEAPYTDDAALTFESILRKHVGSIAAVILEPIVQGAGGMWFYHPKFLQRIKELCSTYGCLLIADEIATGFGRTGKLFACEWAGISPDILCLGKALTGGMLTLAATLATPQVARGISNNNGQNGGVLMHGPTFMANPLACSVACKSIDLLLNSDYQKRIAHIEKLLIKGLEKCGEYAEVADVRVLGGIGVLEMVRPINVEKAQNFFIDEYGVWLRPFGKNIYTMPPYIIQDTELERITAAMQGIVKTGQWE